MHIYANRSILDLYIYSSVRNKICKILYIRLRQNSEFHQDLPFPKGSQGASTLVGPPRPGSRNVVLKMPSLVVSCCRSMQRHMLHHATPHCNFRCHTMSYLYLAYIPWFSAVSKHFGWIFGGHWLGCFSSMVTLLCLAKILHPLHRRQDPKPLSPRIHQWTPTRQQQAQSKYV